MSSYIEIRNVVKSFGNNTVLKHINLDVNEGEMVTLLGPSGCGKSTLLRAIAGLNDVDEGSVFIDGKDVTNVDVRQRQVGMVFQSYALFPNMTAAQNVAFGLSIKKLPKEEIRKKVAAMISLVGLEGKENHRPSQLSGGQQQRVAAARALVTDPTMIMADEPTGALDSKSARLLLESLEALNRRLRATVLMVTHDSFAASYTSRVLFIRDGKIFTELRRGDTDRREFFDRIMEVVAMMGGEGSDAL